MSVRLASSGPGGAASQCTDTDTVTASGPAPVLNVTDRYPPLPTASPTPRPARLTSGGEMDTAVTVPAASTSELIRQPPVRRPASVGLHV